jgi:hypothetical protein
MGPARAWGRLAGFLQPNLTSHLGSFSAAVGATRRPFCLSASAMWSRSGTSAASHPHDHRRINSLGLVSSIYPDRNRHERATAERMAFDAAAVHADPALSIASMFPDVARRLKLG